MKENKKEKLYLLYDKASPPLRFAAERLEAQLAQMENPPAVELYASPQEEFPCEAQSQGYSVYIREGRIIIAGACEAGAMYGGLDTARNLANGGADYLRTEANSMRVTTHNAYVKERGVKLNIPLDARTPSYTDGGDSAQQNIANMWEMDFWRGFLDRMAENKYNTLSLWSLSPFPSLVYTPDFPDTALNDVMRAVIPPRGTLRGRDFYTPLQAGSLVTVKKMTIDEKIKFWREVMEYAGGRCIKVLLFTWNVYAYGTEHTSYGITDDPQNQITRDYIRKSVTALIETYPLLAGIGVTAGENMRREWITDVRDDIVWVMDTYGRGIMSALEKQPERDFTLIHRAHMCSPAQMEEVFEDFPHPLDFSFKYSQAHMYASTKPAFGDDFFRGIKKGRKTWLTVRDDDFYLLRWGDDRFVREYLRGIPHSVVKGFYHGSDGIVRAKDYTSREQPGDYFFDRHRPDFAMWGRLAYDPDLPGDYFCRLMSGWYGECGGALYDALCHASRAIPVLQQVYWNDYDFQWYPEACCGLNEEEDRLFFHDLNMFAAGRSCPGSGYLSVAEYCQGLQSGAIPQGITPVQAAENMRRECGSALDILHTLPDSLAIEAHDLREDIRAMATLGLYYAAKLEAATGLLLGSETAVMHAADMLRYWKLYSSSIARRYRPQRLSRLRHAASPDLFDSAAEADMLIAMQINNTDPY